jgi:hypothetical protein
MRAVNLIPSEQRGGAPVGIGRSEGAAYGVLVLLGGLALLAFIYGRADRQISSRQAQAASLTAQAARAQSQASQLAPYTSFVSLRDERVKAISSLVDSRFDWAHVFHEFGRVLPLEVSISSLSGSIGAGAAAPAPAATPAPAAPAAGGSSAAATPAASTPASASSGASAVASATPPGSVPLFSLAGCATSQPAVAMTLNRLRLMDGVTSVTLQSSTKGSSSSGGGGGGGASSGACAPGQPAFTAQIAFSPLPTPSARPTTAAASATGAPTTSTGGAR